MRLLITTHGGAGHFHPLAPIAATAVRHGHHVAFATEPPFHEHIERAGFVAFPVGTAFDFTEPERTFPDIARHRGLDGAVWAMEHIFFGALAEAALPDVDRLVTEWQPDVVLNETSEVAGLLVAERRGLPHATFNYGGMDLRLLQVIAGRAWNDLRGCLGLPPDPDFTVMTDALVIAALPPRWAGAESDPRILRVGLPLHDVQPDRPSFEPPDVLADLGDGPVVYGTLGTVNRDAAALAALISAFRGLPVQAIVTTGAAIDRSGLDDLPPNVRLSSYVPQSQVLPLAHAVVHHGGFNTMLGAMRFGLPQVLLPMDADQPINAARAAELGLARVVPVEERSPEAIAGAVGHALADPGLAERAREVQAEIEALPPVDAAVDALVRWARAGRQGDGVHPVRGRRSAASR